MIVFFLMPLTAMAEEQEPVKIRVGIENCEEIYMNTLKEPGGFFNVYLSKLYKTMDAEKEYVFEFFPGDIDQVLEMLEEGKVDIAIGETEWQSASGEVHYLEDYSSRRFQTINRSITIDRKMIYISEKNNKIGYEDMENFNGMNVGIMSRGHVGEMLREYCEKNGIQFHIKEYTEYTKLSEDLENGVLDCAIHNYYTREFKKNVDCLGYAMKRLMVKADDSMLLKQFNDANDALFIEDPDFQNDLEKLFKGNKTYRAFDEKARDFIENSRVIRVVCEKFRNPSEYYDEDSKEYKGSHVEILKHIEKYSGFRFELIGADSYDEAVKYIENGDADLILSIFDDKDITVSDNLILTDPYMTTNFYIVGKYNTPIREDSICGLSERENLYGLKEVLDGEFPGWEQVYYDKKADCIQALAHGEIDFTISDEERLHFILAEQEFENIGIIRALKTEISLCFGVSKTSGLNAMLLCDILNQSINQIDEEEYNTIELNNAIAISHPQDLMKVLKENWQLAAALTLLIIAVPTIIIIRNNIRNTTRKYREYLFGIISESINNVVFIYDIDKHSMEYVFENIGWILGLSIRECLENPMAFFDHCNKKEIEDLADDFFSESIQEERVRECHYLNPVTEEELWVEIIVKPMTDKKKKERYIMTVTDLSNDKKSKELLSNALASAEQANLAKTEFLSHISHEIRTPMNGIIGMTTIAESYINDTERVKDCLKKISLSSKHLLGLINDILDMSKIDSGKMVLDKAPFALSDLIDNVVTIVMPQMRAKKINFKVEIGTVAYESLLGDVLRLEQIMLNILSNAIKFTPPEGYVTMSLGEVVKRHSGIVFLEFAIKDTGIGMSREFLEHLFNPFEQEGRKGAGPNKGTGLGMSITKNIVSLMNGTIDVESKVNSGTAFKVKVMLSINEEDRKPEEEQYLEELRVLVADDDKDVCVNTTTMLENIGVLASWVLSGKEAVFQVKKACEEGEDFQVVIIDWKMPEMDGMETAREIRKCVGMDVPIIILSAYDWNDIKDEAYAAGVNAFISKPMFQSKLYDTLIQVTSQKKETLLAENIFEYCRGKNFLLVEDNELNQEIAAVILEETKAHVDLAGDGREAVEIFQKSPEGFYDIIFMDIQMPYLDGYGAARKIRSLPRADAADVAIIAMTANAFHSDVAEAYLAGMNGHISKPIEVAKLYDMIKKQLKKD